MTALEMWCFVSIVCTFSSLLSYIVILLRYEWSKYKISSEDSTARDSILGREFLLELSLFLVVFASYVIFNLVYWFSFLM